MVAVGVRPAAKRKRFGEWAGAANRVPDVSRSARDWDSSERFGLRRSWR